MGWRPDVSIQSKRILELQAGFLVCSCILEKEWFYHVRAAVLFGITKLNNIPVQCNFGHKFCQFALYIALLV